MICTKKLSYIEITNSLAFLTVTEISEHLDNEKSGVYGVINVWKFESGHILKCGGYLGKYKWEDITIIGPNGITYRWFNYSEKIYKYITESLLKKFKEYNEKFYTCISKLEISS